MAGKYRSENLRTVAPAIVRIGLALVFLWFGYTQLQNPEVWVGFLPLWILAAPVTPTTLIMFNGMFEIVFGVALLGGIYVRVVALLLALHLFGIAYAAGGDIGVRDFGLAMATFGVFCFGADAFSLEHYLRKRKRGAEHLETLPPQASLPPQAY